jgi:hypothetical protein
MANSLSTSPSVSALYRWSSSKRTAPYLLRNPFLTWVLRKGRLVKIKLRLNCRNALGKKQDDGVVSGRITRSNSYCYTPCCRKKINESAYHAIGDCAAYAVPRLECFAKIGSKHPSFLDLSSNGKVDFIMGDETPLNVDACIYRFLFKICQIRAKLVDPTLPGQGPSGLLAGPQGRAAL